MPIVFFFFYWQISRNNEINKVKLNVLYAKTLKLTKLLMFPSFDTRKELRKCIIYRFYLTACIKNKLKFPINISKIIKGKIKEIMFYIIFHLILVLVMTDQLFR